MKGNYNILTKEQLKRMDDKYFFTLHSDHIIVGNKNYGRQTAHSRDESFLLILDKGKTFLKITPYAVNLWEKSFKETCSLPEIQNVINTLVVLCQTPSIEDVTKQLQRENNKIKEI